MTMDLHTQKIERKKSREK